MATAGTLFGYAVRSAFGHERLSSAPPARGVIEIDRCAPVVLDPSQITHHDAGSDTSFTIARDGADSLAVVCSQAGGFRIDVAAMRVLADRRAVGDEIWEHRLVSVVIPLLLSETGDVAIHAAAIVRDGRAVVFAGASTRGKSTLALAATSLGLGVLADDGVVIEPAQGGALVWPGPQGLRVVRPGRQLKETLLAPAGPAGAAPLAAVVLLGPLGETEPSLQTVPAVEAVPALLPSLVFSGPDRLPRAFRNAATLAQTVPVHRCRMPRGVERLPASLAAVLEILLRDEGA